MSNVPHYLPGMRMGSRLGHAEVVDGLIKDGEGALSGAAFGLGHALVSTSRSLSDVRLDRVVACCFAAAELTVSARLTGCDGAVVHDDSLCCTVVCCMCCAGLWDPHNDAHMGNCAELCAEHYQISRQEMDDHAVEAFQRAQAAAPFMQAELVPVQLPPSKQSPQGSLLDFDESLSKINESKLRGLKPFFKQVGMHKQNCHPLGGGVCAER